MKKLFLKQYFMVLILMHKIWIVFFSFSGHFSWRNPEAGSWFIQSICKEFEQSAEIRDLLTMLTFVNRRVAIEYQSYMPQNRHFHERKQIPSIVSMLTRLVYFTQKETIKSSSNQTESSWIPYPRSPSFKSIHSSK